MKPVDLRPVGTSEVLITWEDSHRSLYPCYYLRFYCPCAGCVDELTGSRLIKAEEVAKDLRVSQYQPVGNYAIRFLWGDGHQTGIYSYKYLRILCPCEVCKGSQNQK